MAEETKKMGFFKRILTSIKDFDKYQLFAVENIGKAISYLLKLILIFTVVMGLMFTYRFYESITKTRAYIDKEIQQLDYKEGKLTVNEEKPIVIENEKEVVQIIIIATGATEEQQKSYIDNLNQYSSGVLFLKDKVIARTGMLNNSIEYPYNSIAQNYGITEFNKETAINWLNGINFTSLYVAFFITILLYLFMVYTISILSDVLMLAILGFIVARIAGMKMRFKASFSMGCYALTLPIILNLIYIIVNNLTGFTIQYFQWMYTTISYIYMIVAILMIKTDLVNRQMEVKKLEEEQEKVKEEIERQKEEKRQEEEHKENKKPEENEQEEKKQKKEKRQEDKNLGEEPEGV